MTGLDSALSGLSNTLGAQTPDMPKISKCWFVALSGVVLCLAGCTRQVQGGGAGARVVVNYWEKWDGFEADSMRAVVDNFNRSQDRIEVRFLSVSGVDTKLLLATSSGHPPDVAGLWSENIPDFSEKGALTPLDGGLAKAGIGADRYVPLFWDLCRHRGFTWGLPTTPGCVALFLQQEAFSRRGSRPRATTANLCGVREHEP